MSRKQRRELGRRLNLEDPGLDVMQPNAASIYIDNDNHFVAIPSDQGPVPILEHGSLRGDLREMASWPKDCGRPTVAVQSTGVYWTAVQEVLEHAGLEAYLVNARWTRNLPGRMSEVQECERLRKLHVHGLLRNSFRLSTGRDSGGAEDWAAARSLGKGVRTRSAADAKGADHDERAIG